MIDSRAIRVLCALTALVASSCATYRNAFPNMTLSPPDGSSPEWVELCPGVALSRAALGDPDLAVYCVRAALTADGVRARVLRTPASAPASVAANREASLSLVAAAFKDPRLIAAINATPFFPVRPFSGGPCGIVGLSAADGDVASPPSARYGAIVFDKAGMGRIVTGDEADELWRSGDGIAEGAGGFSVILKSGEVADSEFVGKYIEGRAPRSAVGLSREGRFLYLMVIDGKNPGHSVGATFRETALWVRFFGADSALMLDGGGSSAMAARSSDGSWKILNVPVQSVVAGIERPVANRIGVFYSPVSVPSAP